MFSSPAASSLFSQLFLCCFFIISPSAPDRSHPRARGVFPTLMVTDAAERSRRPPAPGAARVRNSCAELRMRRKLVGMEEEEAADNAQGGRQAGRPQQQAHLLYISGSEAVG